MYISEEPSSPFPMHYFTPGPTQAYPKLPEFLRQAEQDQIFSLSHRSPYFQDMFEDMTANLKSLLSIPEKFHVFVMSSATECMERVVENCVGKKSMHIVNGAFSERFYQCALDHQKGAHAVRIDHLRLVDFTTINQDAEVELLAVTQSETSVGMSFSMEEITTLKSAFPNALLALDIVSSAPVFEVDWDVVDMAFFSVQKGFGLPAGLGVFIANPESIQRAETLKDEGKDIGSYHNFLNLLHYRKKSFTHETPNILGVYLLGKVCRDMNEIGIRNIRKEVNERADILYDFLEQHEQFPPLVGDKAHRASTVAALKTPFGSSKLLAHCLERGFSIGSGYGHQKEEMARIANFPVQSTERMKELLEVLSSFHP